MQASLVNAGLVASLAIAMGMRNAVVRRLGVADLATITTLTLTLTGLVADPGASREKGRRARRRVAVLGASFLGAAVGAVLQSNCGVVAPLALTLGLLAASATVAQRASRSTKAWAIAPPRQ